MPALTVSSLADVLVRAAMLFALGAVITLGGRSVCVAEPLPTVGTFEGVYHKDRWGRARIGYYMIPTELEARFAPFEGRRIRFEVTKAQQFSIPGDVSVQEVGSIEPLRAGPDLELGVHRSRGGPEGEWLVSLTNREETPVTVSLHYLRLMYWRPTTLESSSQQAYPRSANAEPTWSTRSQGGVPVVTIPAGATYGFPFTVRVDDPASSELEANYIHWIETVRCPYQKWVRVDGDIPSVDPPRLELRGVSVSTSTKGFASQSAPDDGSYILTGTLVDEAGHARVPMFRHEGVACLPLRVRAQDSHGTDIELDSTAICSDGSSGRDRWPWDLPHAIEPLPRGGWGVRVHFWHRRHFPERPIARLQLEVLSAHGVSRVPIEIPFEDSLRVEPPAWGPAVSGMRIRVRSVPRGQPNWPTAFIVEAVNDASTPKMLFTGQGNGGEIELLIDGEPVPLPLDRIVFGWAAKHTCGERGEYRLRLPSSHRITPGEHTVQVVIRGPGGNWPNANREPIPVIDGEIRTAVTPFTER